MDMIDILTLPRAVSTQKMSRDAWFHYDYQLIDRTRKNGKKQQSDATTATTVVREEKKDRSRQVQI